VRSTLLVLLDQVLQDPALAAPARARGEALLAAVVVPVCVWRAGKVAPPPPLFPRTKWTRRVPHPVLIGHAASLTPY